MTAHLTDNEIEAICRPLVQLNMGMQRALDSCGGTQ